MKVGRAGAGALILAALILTGCPTGQEFAARGPGAGLGLEILGIELMAGGDLARLNYRVTQAEKASAALRMPLKLTAPGDGRQLSITSAGRLGPLRQRPADVGRKHYLMFTNSGRALRRGMQATLTVGGTQVHGIPVL